MTNSRLSHIDALRGIAALLVVYIHFSFQLDEIKHTGKFGYLGVYIFFVISGFILPYGLFISKYQLGDIHRFLFKRILRLEPPYLIAVAFAVGFPVFNGKPMMELPALFAHLGYLNDVLGLKWASGVFWTLAIEFQFYLFVALTYLGYTSKSNFKSLLFIAATLILSIFFQDRVYLPAWLGFFAVGALLFRRIVFGMTLMLFLPAIILALLSIMFLFGIPEFAAVSFSILFILFVRLNASHSYSNLLIKLGIISYSLYLIHIELGKIAFRLTSYIPVLVNHSYLRVSVSIVFAIVVASIFYFLIERPFKQKSSSIKFKHSS